MKSASFSTGRSSFGFESLVLGLFVPRGEAEDFWVSEGAKNDLEGLMIGRPLKFRDVFLMLFRGMRGGSMEVVCGGSQ